MRRLSISNIVDLLDLETPIIPILSALETTEVIC